MAALAMDGAYIRDLRERSAALAQEMATARRPKRSCADPEDGIDGLLAGGVGSFSARDRGRNQPADCSGAARRQASRFANPTLARVLGRGEERAYLQLLAEWLYAKGAPFVAIDPAIENARAQRAYLQLLAERLYAKGAPLVAIDPAIENARAQRAYEKAIFRAEATAATDTGPAVLMLYELEREGQFAFASSALSAPTMPLGAK